ncbi:MAG: sigma 54-interacting transcriptional regulator, partial [Spirochaetes bacterium]|nr:sigma 54-interacting transcriptional regulator [Spirochaetota bacterium]
SCIEQVMGVRLFTYKITREEEGVWIVEKALEAKVEALVGGLMVTKIAASKGIPTTVIESGYESIRQAIDEAIRVAIITRAERARVERFRTILDYSYEGIIAVDEKGTIALFNKSAKDIINLPETDLIGSHIDEVFPEIGLSKVLQTGKEELETIQKVNETTISANRVPVFIGKELVGAVATFQKISKIQEMEEKIRKKMYMKGFAAKYTFQDVIGKSPVMQRAIAMAMHYSGVDSNILLLGETGTGKELFAQSIHNHSSRRSGPFVAINCAAIPENLLESELFGYVEGAFTGAVKQGKAGLFEIAHNGTIFLDEISELSLPLQARLLRVLQEKEIVRLGGDRVIPINVRVIAASNRSLKELVKEGKFRKDLLYRIDVLSITIPPLRERKEDIPYLIEHYLKQHNRKFGKTIRAISDEAMQILLAYSWPGNIRELVNICERLSIITTGETVTCADVKAVLLDEETACIESSSPSIRFSEIDSKIFERNEKEIIMAALNQSQFNKKQAAKLLGIDYSTLWRKMKKYSISIAQVPQPRW